MFSHHGKLEIMREAAKAGYKVYLYFVATSSPLINIERVAERKESGGHDVPSKKIESRYYRSLDLLHEAAQLSNQSFFFDNSGKEAVQIAHFKIVKGKKQWDEIDINQLPDWFIQYYLNKVKK